MSNPKRQHVVPKMLLKHFTDDRGQLWCWRRGSNESLFQSSPSDAFTSRYIYTRFGLDGDKDFSLEKHWDSLEAKMEPILARLLKAVRGGTFPEFRHEDWLVWLRFYYALRSRSPLEAREHSETAWVRSQAEEVLAKCHAVEGVSFDFLDRLPSAQWLEKEVILRVQAAGPSPRSAEFLANSGLLILRVTNSKRSLIIGDRPGATATIRIGATSQRHTLQFVAVAWDCALVAVPNAAGWVGVGHVVDAGVRAMNEATLARSSMIAGRSEELLRSLTRTQ